MRTATRSPSIATLSTIPRVTRSWCSSGSCTVARASMTAPSVIAMRHGTSGASPRRGLRRRPSVPANERRPPCGTAHGARTMARMTDGAGPSNAESPAVSRDRVVDPLTGLPVLRYRGAIAPTLRPGAPTPAGAWRLLRADRSGPTWVVDLETAGTATSFAEAPELADDVAVA